MSSRGRRTPGPSSRAPQQPAQQGPGGGVGEVAGRLGNSMMNWVMQTGGAVHDSWDNMSHLLDKGGKDLEPQVVPSGATDEGPAPAEEAGGMITRYGLARQILGMKPSSSGKSVGQQALSKGLFSDPGKLRLEDPVTRAEAAKMLCAYFGIAPLPTGDIRRTFGDLSVTNWAAPAIYGAVKVGVLNGYGDETFKPQGNLDAAFVPGLVAKAKTPPGKPGSFDPTVEWGKRAIIEGKSRAYTRNDMDEGLGRDASGSAEDKVAKTNKIVDALSVGTDKRYDPGTTAAGNFQTYCNVFAHDYAFLMGAYLPRTWWSKAVLEHYAKTGEIPEPAYGKNCYEMNANQLYDWLDTWGPKFGWNRLGETDAAGLTTAQDAANQGLVVIISANTGTRASGHITAVVPETTDATAARDENGKVKTPLQSQAGADPQTRGTSHGQWWDKHNKGYPGGKGIYVHS